MKVKRYLILITAVLAVFALCGCAKKTKQDVSEAEVTDVMTLNDDESYSPKEGDFYIGAILNYVGDASLEIDLICKDGVVVDCGGDGIEEKEFQKGDYIGLSYMDAVEKFYEKFSALRNVKDADEIMIALTPDMDNDRDPIVEEFKNFAQKICFPPDKIKVISDEKERFNEKVASFTVNAVKQKEQDNVANNPENGNSQTQIPSLIEVTNFNDLKDGYEAGCTEFVLANDVNIDLNACTPYGTLIDCNGHSVTVSGTIRYVKSEGSMEVHFQNPGMVDLSAVSVDEGSFDPDKMVRLFYGLSFSDGDYKNLKMPEGVPSRTDFVDFAPFEGHAWSDINDEGTNFSLSYQGPACSYEELHENEMQIMTAILTEGDAEEFDVQNHLMIWTKLEIDVGDAVLPNQDYWGFKLMPGASLKVKGQITITGGQLDWNISEGDQLDLRELTLVKKHPSPDMVKIRYDSDVKVNEDLLKAKGANGKIMFDKGSESFNITMW